METKFQTSFIPRKPLVSGDPRTRQPSGGGSVFMSLAVIIFIVSIAGAGFVLVWQKVLLKSQATYQSDLVASQQRFNTDKITELKTTGEKIDLVKQILQNHLSVSEVFTIIGGLTIDGVRFSSLEYTGPDSSAQTPLAHITMKGLANSFSSIAWQSDVLGSSAKYGTNIVIKNPILSDLDVDANGNVGFDFAADINPADISYEKVLTNELQAEGLIQAPASTTPITAPTN